jgi:ketosteroid isomerase-like protein
MKVVIAVLLAFALATPAGAADGSDADKQALRDVARLFEQAVGQRDLKRFQAVLAPEFRGTLVTDEVVNRESMAGLWNWIWGLIGAKGRWEVKVDPEDTMFFGDLAVARGAASDHIQTESGRDYRFTWHWTLVLQKRDNQWKAIAGHGSMDPLGNPFVKLERTWIKLLFGGGGLAVGVVAGIGGMLLLRRRRTAS